MADAARILGPAASAAETTTTSSRHSATVRVTHWITALCFFALLVSGAEIVISHPRFYWGEVGNVLTDPLFSLPIPASRSAVPTGYGFVLPDQNGWSRSLHFQAAWLAVFTGLYYVLFGLLAGHFRKNLIPASSDLTPSVVWGAVRDHLRFKEVGSAGSYNILQRLAYSGVVFILFPLMIWTGLAMSPAVNSAFPLLVSAFGGHQSARTIHFIDSVLLVLFLVVHLVMVYRAGFIRRTRAMITGHQPEAGEGA